MSSELNRRLECLSPELLRQLQRGIEKEGLRVQADGHLALTPHPRELGSALTHPHITTDFSESQLELVTGVHASAQAVVGEATELHQVVMAAIGPERMWAASMPCALPEDGKIPLGQYGSSHTGTAKTVYRMGLSHRYGRRMQTISGIHYNFSMPQAAWPALTATTCLSIDANTCRDNAYFSLIRNFRRHSWLLLYLYGASPALASCFVADRPHPLQRLSADTMYLPHATSLRMGPLGYQSDAQASLKVSYNSLRDYALSLAPALTQPYPAYEQIGIKGPEGYRQMSTTLLQIENEFYGTIRPKRGIQRGERPLHALSERGVEYVEVRCMDIDPFLPVGIDARTMRFLDVFLMHCLLEDSPPDSPSELEDSSENRFRVALRGREPGLQLLRKGQPVALKDWAQELLDALRPVAEALDRAHGNRDHERALDTAQTRIGDASLTPSALVLDTMAAAHGNSHLDFVRAQTERHWEVFTGAALPAPRLAHFRAMAETSLAEQAALEAADTLDFETWRQRYIDQDLLARFGTPA